MKVVDPLVKESSMAISEKDCQNELAFNESVWDQSFESVQSYEPLTIPKIISPMQKMQLQHSKPQ